MWKERFGICKSIFQAAAGDSYVNGKRRERKTPKSYSPMDSQAFSSGFFKSASSVIEEAPFSGTSICPPEKAAASLDLATVASFTVAPAQQQKQG
ncbi:hypothetical protein ACPA9J_16885 [Pseudomonas aeruginosa]